MRLQHQAKNKSTLTDRLSRMNPSNNLNNLQWQCASFAELSNLQLHAIYQARSAVFVLEQNCVYQDVDGKDPRSHHLTAWTPAGEVAAYLRIVPAGLPVANRP